MTKINLNPRRLLSALIGCLNRLVLKREFRCHLHWTQTGKPYVDVVARNATSAKWKAEKTHEYAVVWGIEDPLENAEDEGA